MRFFINGVPKIVVVDDYLPYRTDLNSLAFARSKYQNEFWVSILEKAWAKLHGSYCMVEGGTSDSVFSHLTNRPTELLNHRKKKFSHEKLWSKLKAASRLKCLMTCESSEEKTYAVVCVVEVMACGKIERLVKVKNPHGNNIWGRKGSPKKPMRTSFPSLKYSSELEEKGQFLIAYEDYLL